MAIFPSMHLEFDGVKLSSKSIVPAPVALAARPSLGLSPCCDNPLGS
jgi:hypothetical protein